MNSQKTVQNCTRVREKQEEKQQKPQSKYLVGYSSHACSLVDQSTVGWWCRLALLTAGNDNIHVHNQHCAMQRNAHGQFQCENGGACSSTVLYSAEVVR